MVTCHPVQTSALQRRAAEQITTTHYQAHLDPDTDELTDFQGNRIQHFGINPEALVTRQRFTAQLEQNPVIARRALLVRRHVLFSTTHKKAPPMNTRFYTVTGLAAAASPAFTLRSSRVGIWSASTVPPRTMVASAFP